MSDLPLWRLGFDRVERLIGAPLEAGVETRLFADVVARGRRLEHWVWRQTERRTRRWLHLWNVPAASDVRRVREQVAGVDRQLRALAKRLDDEGPVPADGALRKQLRTLERRLADLEAPAGPSTAARRARTVRRSGSTS